jgi:hypothetical protein
MTGEKVEKERCGDEVAERLARWLEARDRSGCVIERLAGDVSTRQYFRVRSPASGRSFVAAFYPGELAGAQVRFTAAARLLRGAGVRVPMIEIDDPARGFALLEDVGAATLYESAARWEECPRELEAALDAASRVAALPRAEVVTLGSPPLDAALLWRELESTIRLLLAPGGLAGEALLAGLEALCRRVAEEEPLAPCHRDLMARNLVPDGVGGLTVLDFQDLRLGPAAYDLASMLNDSFFASAALERELLARFGFTGEREAAYRRAVVQRSLKAAGTYLRFAERGFRRHLPLVAPTLGRALPHLALLPETRAEFRATAARWSDAVTAAEEAIC